MKYMARKGKMVIKKWGLGVKKWVLGLQKLWVGRQSRKAKWYKMQVVFLKLNIL